MTITVFIFVLVILVILRQKKKDTINLVLDEQHFGINNDLGLEDSGELSNDSNVDGAAVSKRDGVADSYKDSAASSKKNDAGELRRDIDAGPNGLIDFDKFEKSNVQKGRFESYTVSRNCELREYVESDLQLKFKRGCAFYEFQQKFKYISEDKELIVIHMVNNDVDISWSLMIIIFFALT